jgi:hypothetical protein
MPPRMNAVIAMKNAPVGIVRRTLVGQVFEESTGLLRSPGEAYFRSVKTSESWSGAWREAPARAEERLASDELLTIYDASSEVGTTNSVTLDEGTGASLTISVRRDDLLYKDEHFLAAWLEKLFKVGNRYSPAVVALGPELEVEPEFVSIAQVIQTLTASGSLAIWIAVSKELILNLSRYQVIREFDNAVVVRDELHRWPDVDDG